MTPNSLGTNRERPVLLGAKGDDCLSALRPELMGGALSDGEAATEAHRWVTPPPPISFPQTAQQPERP